MRASRSASALRLREWIIARLGGTCAVCGSAAYLQCDLVVSDGGKHHSLSYPDRQRFYLSQLNLGNLQLLCPRCHVAKTLLEVRQRKAGLLTSPRC